MLNDRLEQLYSKYYRQVYLYALSLCRSRHQADDLTSETFFKALLSLQESTPYIKYWLFRVCKNLYLDSMRKKQKVSLTDDFPTLATTEANPLDRLIDNEQSKNLYAQVLQLRPSYREVIILFYHCDLTVKEIAAALGATEGAVKVLLFRARKKLKSALEEKNEI
jgi:RNA polymerase sigma-70 factor (ECF subfamily)